MACPCLGFPHFGRPPIFRSHSCMIYSDHVSNKNITVDLRSNRLSLQIKSPKKPNSPNKKKRKKKSSHLGTTIDVTITQIMHVHTSIICIKYTLSIYKKCAIKIWNQYMTCSLILLSSLLFVSLLQIQVVLVLWNFQNCFFGALSFSKFKLTQIILFDQILYYLAISKI